MFASFTSKVVSLEQQPTFDPSADMARPTDRLVAIFEAFVEDKTRGRTARAIKEILDRSTEQVETVVGTYLAGCKDREERLRGAATMLGVLVGSSGPRSALQATVDSIVADADTDFMVELIAKGAFSDAHLQLPQTVCDNAWLASAAIKDDLVRQGARRRILDLMPDRTAIFKLEIVPPVPEKRLLMKDEELQTQPVDLYDLIDIGARHLSAKQCDDLEAVSLGSEDLYRFVRWMMQARTKETSGGRSARRLVPKRSRSDRPGDAEQDEFDQLVELKGEALPDPQFKRALYLARQTFGYGRSQRMLALAKAAPPPHKRAMIAEALAESGAIDDRPQAWQTITNLASILGREEAAARFGEALTAVSQLNPEQAVEATTNIGCRAPREARTAWAKCAVDAARRIAPDTADSARAMARVVCVFPEYAPFAFTLRALRILRHFPEDFRSGWIYRDLVCRGGLRGLLAATVALARYRGMSPAYRMDVTDVLRLRYPHLLFWLPPAPGVISDALGPNAQNFHTIVNLVKTFRGGRRKRRLVAQAVALLPSTMEELRQTLSDQRYYYYPIGILYEQSDTPGREKIRKVIAGCDDETMRLYYEILFFFPKLAESERSELGPRLLQEIDSQPWSRVVADPFAVSRRFDQLLVLFLNCSGDLRTKALLAMLRVGAHMSRNRWFSYLGDIARQWPANMQARVSAPLLEAMRDVVRLWP
jgi:hypothetical protein